MKNIRVLDLGWGTGGQSIRLAKKGCDVTAIDIQDFSTEIRNSCEQYRINNAKINFIACDIRNTREYLIGTFHYLYSQRALHYINYYDAEKLLKALKQHFVPKHESKLFISVSGFDSELCENYEDRHKPLTN